ncbi:hypothetical protein BUALT_Bualt03G0226500 [Buddleja alternifolia]|uniref:F-box domain-containing protein n=1 Tax=Buddleja alternifolia TaxID=168488 RepID=A0AAV6Y796_9LAMI|nr:hypothetical protein BUALT_Bualt03G0226500 [Buddleja alternifolia]
MSDNGIDHARLRCDCVCRIGYFEEIVINILARLPVKDVVTCKCVAKHWLRIISEPHFPALQLSWSEKKPKYIICPYPEYTDIVTHLSLMEENGIISRTIPLPAFDHICSPKMVCFLNGLICSVDEYEDEDEDYLIDVNIRVFNPNTQDIVLLPRGSPSNVTPSVGLAFDPKTYDFKAFRFFSDSSEEDDVKYKCEVYTSSSAEWRIISEGVEHPEDNIFNSFSPNYVKCRWKNVLVYFFKPGQHEDPNPYVEVYKLKDDGWCLRAKAELDLMDIHSFNSVAARDNEIFFIIRLEDESFCYLIFDLSDGTWVTLNLVETFEEYSPVAFPFVESLLKYCGSLSTVEFGMQMEEKMVLS